MIGQYATRMREGQAVTKSHLIESEIADRVVTRCGRQLLQANNYGYLRIGEPLVICRVCQP